jgi:hypothetical protein
MPRRKGRKVTVKELTDKVVNCDYKVISHWHTNLEYPVSNVLDKKVLSVSIERGKIIISV